MARNNFAAIRYKVFAILECDHELEGTYLHPMPEGTQVVCKDCDLTTLTTIVASECEVYSVGQGW